MGGKARRKKEKKEKSPYQRNGLRDSGRCQGLANDIHQDLIGMGSFVAAFQQ